MKPVDQDSKWMQRNLVPEPSQLLREYVVKITPTDKLPQEDLRPVLLGLFGEVGSIMATSKKLHREREAYAGYQHAVEEEFGDALWYAAALCRRLNLNVAEIFSEATNAVDQNKTLPAPDSLKGTIFQVPLKTFSSLDESLLKLGEAAAALFGINISDDNAASLLRVFAIVYVQTLQSAGVTFHKVVQENIEKACGRFLEPDLAVLPTFDHDFLAEERIPQHFEINFTQRKSGHCHLQWNGVFVGEPLTDNILDPDEYRFHDVFHLAYAAILHWSPTFRAMIKQKRKSNPEVDEAQDGGRAIVVEEGLTAWIFTRAKELNFFEGQNSISFDLLKGVQQFVRGYEVEACPLKLWETAILNGYEVFRQIRENNCGIVVGDRQTRTISYVSFQGE